MERGGGKGGRLLTIPDEVLARLADRPPIDAAPDLSVSTLGLLCPLPLVKTARALMNRPAGCLVEVIADDPGALDDFPVWCAERGHEYLGAWAAGRALHLLVRRGASS